MVARQNCPDWFTLFWAILSNNHGYILRRQVCFKPFLVDNTDERATMSRANINEPEIIEKYD